jgi:dolichyl-phosphate-mannose--protein O-mannosyl transferase
MSDEEKVSESVEDHPSNSGGGVGVSSVAAEGSNDWLSKLWIYFRPKILSFNIGHILLILLGLHLFAMSFPNNSGAYVFDESYYVGSSHFDQDLLNLIPSNLEHPFFGKIWGALGIYLFGDNFFGWRILYVMIGVLTVWVFYELALVFFSKEKALFAASLLGFETLFFIHTSVALLEGPPLLFGLLGFVLYFKKRYYLAALAFGLAIISKEWGLYFLVALGLYEFYLAFRPKSSPIQADSKTLVKFLVFLAILVLVVLTPLYVYDLLYHPTSADGVNFTNPVANFQYYYDYHTSLTLGPYNPNGSTCHSNNTASECDPWHYAWFWIDPFTVSPDTYYAVTVSFSVANKVTLVTTPIDWVGVGNLVIWYALWAIVPYVILKPLITRKFTHLEAFVGIWILATYGPSLALSGIFHRVVYAFYFINVDPALCLGIPLLINFIAPDSLSTQRGLMALWLGAAIVFFILFFPVHPGPGL